MDFKYNNQIFKQRRSELRKNQTEAEKALWSRLRNNQIYGLRFHRQYSVGGYILDFFNTKLRLAIELDGGQHAEEENREYDEIRTSFLKGHDIEVLRFWNNEVVENIEGVLHRIEEKVGLQREERLTPPDSLLRRKA